MKNILWISIVLGLIVSSCGNEKKSKTEQKKSNQKSIVNVPEFNADSAYQYVYKQVEFGPRVPDTKEHSLCSQYLYNKLKSYADTALIQSFKTRAYNGTTLNGKNIIGSFKPEKSNRVLLCAHWDSRPYADHDPDPANHRIPIDGANDGASGVGVLIEIARQLKINNPSVGIDIIFFDVEDYGPPQDSQKRGQGDYWGLGSQYWSKNLHDPDYNAKYGILLDMVGASDARFYMEYYSMTYASGVLKKVWNTAHRLGYNENFLFIEGGGIDDDHLYINMYAKIPTIDIIHMDRSSSNGSFFEHWHTIQDNIETIDKETLKIVGQTLLTVIFEEK